MSGSTIAAFLGRLERETQRTVRTENSAMVVTPALLGAMGVWQGIDAVVLMNDWDLSSSMDLLFWIGSTGLGLVIGGAIGLGLVRLHIAAINRAREEVHHKLIDGGLLQILLDPEGPDRLPRLIPWQERAFRRRLPGAEQGTLEARLRQFCNAHPACMEDADLLPQMRKRKALARWLMAMGCAILLGLTLSSGLEPGIWQFSWLTPVLFSGLGVALTLPLLKIQFHEWPMRKAVRLELVSVLQGTVPVAVTSVAVSGGTLEEKTNEAGARPVSAEL